jgi:hypothetical protein
MLSSAFSSLFRRPSLADRVVAEGLARMTYSGLLVFPARDLHGRPAGEVRSLARKPEVTTFDFSPARDAHFSLGAIPYDADEIRVAEDVPTACALYLEASDRQRLTTCFLARTAARSRFAIEHFLTVGAGRVRCFEATESPLQIWAQEWFRHMPEWLSARALAWARGVAPDQLREVMEEKGSAALRTARR